VATLKIKEVKEPDKIITYWKKETFVVVCITVFGLLFNGTMILGPIYQGKLIDSIVAGSSLKEIIRLAVIFVLFILMTQVFRYIKRFYIRRFANRTSASVRLIIYNNIMNRSTGELTLASTGDLMTRVISDVELCVEGMRKFTTEIFDTGVLMLTYLITLLAYDAKITALSVAFIPVAMFLAEKLKSFIYKYSAKYRKKSSEVTAMTYELIDNAMLYRVNGLDETVTEQYGRQLSELQSYAVKANILEGSMQPVYQVIAMVGVWFALYLGGMKVIDNGWTVGTFSSYITIFIAMAAKASKASKLFNSVQKSSVSWKRIKPYLTEHHTKDTDVRRVSENVVLSVDKLIFCYPGASVDIIKDISFKAELGEIIGITGQVASGKSTLGLAITGLYPYIGSIRINDRELKDYSEYERSRMISYLGHRPELLSDTIYNNITLGENMDITSLLEDVCFDTDLAGMPDRRWRNIHRALPR
jgi:ABC-type multidrug transport system fused ATPase/permease subunit